MANSRGKEFEQRIRQAFSRVPDISIDRLHDQTTGYKGSQNICDFIVYRQPHQYYFECKSIQGNTLPFSNITETQWKGLLEKSWIKGVFAGVICWWVDKDITKFLSIQLLQSLKEAGSKSIRYDNPGGVVLPAEKKRKYFDYDVEQFLDYVEE